MGFTTLSLRQKNAVKKYILFYADYLQEAWLSEVLHDDETRIVRQFTCRNQADLDHLASYISKKGELVNLASSGNAEPRLKVVERELLRRNQLHQNISRLWQRLFVLPRLRPAF
jgi:hypothetical protein